MSGLYRITRCWMIIVAFGLWCLGVSEVWAHKASDAYLSLRQEGMVFTGQWDIHLRDLDFVLGLDRDSDHRITWKELREQTDTVAAYALSHLTVSLSKAETCPLAFTGLLTDQHTDGGYAVLQFIARCPAATDVLSLDYRLFFDVDAQHRGLLSLQTEGTTISSIFAPSSHRQEFRLSAFTLIRQFQVFLANGVEHIFSGYDHQLFLLCLLLPCVYRRQQHRWQPQAGFTPVLIDVAKVVTAFTVAHSMSLSLAVLGYLNLPSRWVEASIAFTVIVAAANNLWPLVQDRRWYVAFGFGLIHGLGFASVLNDLGLQSGSLMLSLLAFNLGVELGQLAIVAVFLPCAYLLRETSIYRQLVLQCGSLAIVIVGAVWFYERSFDVTVRSLWP